MEFQVSQTPQRLDGNKPSLTALIKTKNKKGGQFRPPDYFWWRRGRVELPVQRNLLKIYYRLS